MIVDDSKNLLNIVLVREEDRKRLLNVMEFGGARVEILDHYLVVVKRRCFRYWAGRMD